MLATHPDIIKEKPEAAAQGRAGVHRGDEDPQDRSQARQGADGEGISRP